MLTMPNRAAKAGCSSVFTLASRARGSSAFAACSKAGRHHVTGAAPRSPEIHYQRDGGAGHMEIELRFREPDGMAGEEGLMTTPATGPLAEACSRNAIDAVAVGTDDM